MPTRYAHDTFGTYSVHSSMAPLPLPPAFSTVPPTPARIAHPSYPDASAQDYPFSSYKSISTTEHNQGAAHKKFPYQTNKSKISSLKTPISSPTPSPKTLLVSSGVGTLFVASALLAISSAIAFFNPCTCSQSATFHNLINLKYAGCGPSRDSCVSVRV